MSDGTLIHDFVSKCQSDIAPVRTRLSAVMEKKKDKLNRLEVEVVDLLKNGSKSEAYCKVGEYVAERNTSRGCQMINDFCGDLLNYLPNMAEQTEQSECPLDCKIAASSLMFAAAKFADFPELDKLRTTLFERYGVSLDGYLDRELAECLSLDKKLDSLLDIAGKHKQDGTWIASRITKLKITLADTPPTSSNIKTKLKNIPHPETPQEHFNMFHRVREAHIAATNRNARAIENLRSKIAKSNSMFVKTDDELDCLSPLNFRGDLYIGCNVSTAAVQRYKDSHDDEVNSRIREKIVLHRNVPN